MKKKAIAFVIVTSFALCCVAFWIIRHNMTSSKENADNIFSTRREEFQLISDYLLSLDCEEVCIDDADGTLLLFYYEEAANSEVRTSERSIESEAIRCAVQHVFSAGCNKIFRNDETIEFLFWTRFNDFGAGIVCCKNAITSPEIQFLTKLEPLSSTGWYYYETDFNEWRSSK